MENIRKKVRDNLEKFAEANVEMLFVIYTFAIIILFFLAIWTNEIASKLIASTFIGIYFVFQVRRMYG